MKRKVDDFMRATSILTGIAAGVAAGAIASAMTNGAMHTPAVRQAVKSTARKADHMVHDAARNISRMVD